MVIMSCRRLVIQDCHFNGIEYFQPAQASRHHSAGTLALPPSALLLIPLSVKFVPVISIGKKNWEKHAQELKHR
ncbi:MAG: hypothetical protein R3B74_03400 [Nitrospirales bacterium]|nr:hypothetical protein [Nitrospirales bacterium]